MKGIQAELLAGAGLGQGNSNDIGDDEASYAGKEMTSKPAQERCKTVQCVIGGFRYGSNSHLVGSLLLGLYSDDGEFHHIGFAALETPREKRRITHHLEEIKRSKSFTANAPAAPKRWKNRRNTEWVPTKPLFVVEVEFDQNAPGVQETKILRFRPDKTPRQCTFRQIA